MNKPLLSVNSYSFHGLHNVGVMDLYGFLYSLKYRYGLSSADIWNGFIESYAEEKIAQLKNMLEGLDMSVAALCCDQAHVWDNDERVRAANEKMALDCLRLAREVGAKFIRIDVGIRDEEIQGEKLDYVIKKYTEYCRIAAEFGACVGPENHWGASRKPDELQKLFDRMKGVKNFGLQLHLGNWDVDDKDAEDLRFVKYARHMHLDFAHCYNLNDQHLIDLQLAGYTGIWSIEHHSGTNEYENVAFQLANVKRILKPDYYTTKPLGVQYLLERTVPGFIEGLKIFLVKMQQNAEKWKAVRKDKKLPDK